MHPRSVFAIIAPVMLAGIPPAAAEIHDYMILRLLYLETSCGTQTLVRVEAEHNERRFKATCHNVIGYPEGLTVHCPDLHDDRLCRIETEAKSFKHLHLIQPGPDGAQ